LLRKVIVLMLHKIFVNI